MGTAAVQGNRGVQQENGLRWRCRIACLFRDTRRPGRAGSGKAIFTGSTENPVAGARLSMTGNHGTRVCLTRSAARRNETADLSPGVSLGATEFADGLSGGPDCWKVPGVGGGSASHLRAGPSTRHKPVSKLRNGDMPQNRGLRMTGGQRWCSIRAAHSGVEEGGAGRYLVEAAAPRATAMPKGGPIGNGTPSTPPVPCCAARSQRVMRARQACCRVHPSGPKTGRWRPAAGFQGDSPFCASGRSPQGLM